MELDSTSILSNLGTPEQPQMTGLQWVDWVNQAIKKEDEKIKAWRIHTQTGKKVVWTPAFHEFGHLLIHHVREVYFSRAEKEIVGISKGFESLYPNATAFYYDFQDLIPDKDKQGTDRYVREFPDISLKYPHHLIVQAGGLSMSQEFLIYEPRTRIQYAPIRRNLTPVDCLLATRNRQFLPTKNYQHMQQVADAIISRGYTVGQIGTNSTSVKLENISFFSGDYPDIDAAIEMIQLVDQRSGWFVAQDCGAQHLISSVGCNQIVLMASDKAMERNAPVNRDFSYHMKEINYDRQVVVLEKEYWDDVPRTLDAILQYFPQKKALDISQEKKSAKQSKKAKKHA